MKPKGCNKTNWQDLIEVGQTEKSRQLSGLLPIKKD